MRYIAAAIILTAALLKAHQLATVLILGEGFLHHRGFNLFVVEFELFFGIWLLFGLLPKLTWLATTALFLLFALVSFYKAISGEASCGCFGNVTVNPWFTTVFDLLIIGLLSVFHPLNMSFQMKEAVSEIAAVLKPQKLYLPAAVWLLVAVPVSLAMLENDKMFRFLASTTHHRITKPRPARAGGLLCENIVWNFGSRDSDGTNRISHEFILLNESKEPVTIKNVQSACGCMVAKDYDEKLQPGKSTKIRVEVQLPSMPGPFNKNLAVQVGGEFIPLYVVGKISANPSLHCVPNKVNFGTVRPGETKERSVQVVRYDLSPLTLQELEGLPQGFSVEAVQEQKHKIVLKIKLKADTLPAGQCEKNIKIFSSDKEPQTLNIPVSAYAEKK
ncbi:hypothetical protein FACS189419_06470 [Planctomycetales bacterium]|nr:hypothetical protein FACS189419_06470 [Planctomycetales bacterium]